MKRRSIMFAVAAVALTSMLVATATASTNAAKPSLTVAVKGKGKVTSKPSGINCPAKCKAGFKSGGSVTLVAHPASGWKLSKWSGACKGTKGSCALKLASSKSARAVFTEIPSSGGGGGGSGGGGGGSPPPTGVAKPGHYAGKTADNENWSFDIGSDGLSLANLQTGQINQSCQPPDITLAGGNLTDPGPETINQDGTFSFSATLSGSVGGNPSTDVITIAGAVKSDGTASGTYKEDTTFTDSSTGTAYSCTSGNQTWTASAT
jgi:hypothetical protein